MNKIANMHVASSTAGSLSGCVVWFQLGGLAHSHPLRSFAGRCAPQPPKSVYGRYPAQARRALPTVRPASSSRLNSITEFR